MFIAAKITSLFTCRCVSWSLKRFLNLAFRVLPFRYCSDGELVEGLNVITVLNVITDLNVITVLNV